MTLPISDIYESRVERDAAIIVRHEPVIYAEEAFPKPDSVSEGDLHDYARDGFLLIPEVFSLKEVNALRAEIERMTKNTQIAQRQECVIEPDSKMVRSIFTIHKLSKMMARLSQDERLVNIARHILGSEVYLHQTRANLKPEFEGKEFYWHSDFETWHVEDGMPEMRAISFSVLLTENNAFNGPLFVIPGSHQYFISCVGRTPEDNFKQSLQRQEYGTPDKDSLKILMTTGGIRSMTGPPGSVVIFDCNTMHASNGNISLYPRTNIFMVYNSVHNRLRDPRFGLQPRPEHIATRDWINTITSGKFDFGEEDGSTNVSDRAVTAS